MGSPQDQLALLLAVDPAAPDGDRLVGYQLIHGSVDAQEIEKFLLRLKKAGVEPDEVVTDGSQLYPAHYGKSGHKPPISCAFFTQRAMSPWQR